MNLSKTSEYALRILSYMVLKNEPQYTAQQLHDELGIPHRYLRRLLTRLSACGFIQGNKGKGGGFFFSRDAGQIFLADIIDAIEGFQVYDSCLFGYQHCLLTERCPMHDAWHEARKNIRNILKNTSLADIAGKKNI